MGPNGTTFIRWFSDIGSRGCAASAHALPAWLSDAEELHLRLARTVGAIRTSAREATCAIGGHEYMLHASDQRIYLRCADCGRETPGWQIDAKVARETTGRR